MADKGLVSKSTLQGFADEVRRLAESEQTGTPAEMLALLQAVEAGGGAVVKTGTITFTGSGKTFSLGSDIVGPDYVFMMGNAGYTSANGKHDVGAVTGNLRIALITCVDGTISSTMCVYGYDPVINKDVTVNLDTGKVTLGGSFINYSSNKIYWVFVGGKLS